MFISMKKMNFITHLFLEVLQKYCIFILNTLKMPGHVHQIRYHLVSKSEIKKKKDKLMSRFQATLVSDGRTDAQVHGRRRMNYGTFRLKQGF